METEGIALKDAEGGCKLEVKVKPAARQDTLIGPYSGRLKMTVTAAPERGRANEAVARVVAGALNVMTSRVRVIAGFTSQEKIVYIEGLSADEVRLRFEKMPRMSTGPKRGD